MAQAILRAIVPKPEPEKQNAAAPPAETKVLRVGVIEDGRITEEQIITRRTAVSVGPSERNTFVIPSTLLPSRFELFERVAGGYRLCFTEEMRGRVAHNGSAEDLLALRRSGKAKRRGRLWTLDLHEGCRGKIVIGEHTLLFQFVTPPPVQPRPQLPASVRGGHLRSIDWVFTAIVSVSFLAQVGFVVFLVNNDWPHRGGFELMPDHLRDYVFASAPTVEELREMQQELDGTVPADAEATSESDPEPSKAQPLDRPDRSPAARSGPSGASAAEDQARREVERRARIRDALDDAVRASILGAFSPDEDGVVADVMRGGGVDGDLDRIIADARAVRIADSRGDSVIRGPRSGDGSSSVASIEGLRSRIKTGVAESDAIGEEREISGKVGRGTPREGPRSIGKLSPEAVRRAVGRNLGGIKRCYERALPRNPTLAGRITVNFTIGGGGRVVSASSGGDTMGEPRVTECVVRSIRSIRFPAPEGGNVDFSYPFIFAPMN